MKTKYDNANRLTQIQQGSSATVTIAPDADGRRQSVTLPNGVSMNYGYDAASQLTGITYKLGTNTLGNLTYGYDLAGRRTAVGGSYARTGVPATASAASYNVNNQLTNWKGATLTYDLNGNLTSDGTNTYTWNARNQLVTISGTVNASFQYDAFGRRVSKNIGGTTQFLYDGANPVQEISGSSASANLITGGVDQYFQRTDSAGPRNFLTDALGSTLALADSTATLQTQYTFEPFGNTTVTGSSTTNSFAFTGRELDATGLYFYRARYYHPALQRFIQEDRPALSRPGSSVYAYVGNDPADWVDPSGWEIICPINNPACTAAIAKHLTPCAKDALQPYFPGLDLNTVIFVPELPGFMLSGYSAITLGNTMGMAGPGPMMPNTLGNTVAYDPSLFPGKPDNTIAAALGDIGHELTHVVQQRNDSLFFSRYIWNAITRGYDNIPAEIEAYAAGKRLKDLFGRKDLSGCPSVLQ